MSYLELLKQELAKSGATGTSVPFVAPIPVIPQKIPQPLDKSKGGGGMSYLDRLKQEIAMQPPKSGATGTSVPFVAPMSYVSQKILPVVAETDLPASTPETAQQNVAHAPRIFIDQRTCLKYPKNTSSIRKKVGGSDPFNLDITAD